MTYSIYELPTWQDKQMGSTLGGCITERDNLDAALDAARRYYAQRNSEDGIYGDDEINVIVMDQDETRSELTLKFRADQVFDAIGEYGTWNKASAGVR